MNVKSTLGLVGTLGILLAGCRAPDTPQAASAASQPAEAATAQATPSPKELDSMPITANATLDQSGSLRLEAGDAALTLKASGCREAKPGIQLCNKDVELAIAIAGGEPTRLQPASIYIDGKATLYRGPLDASYKQNGHSLILADVDGDGHEDLILWSGLEGNYGGPSYEVYLFDPGSRAFVLNQALSDITVMANGLFSIEDGKLKSASGDGCCLHVYDTYRIDKREPVLIERVTEDTQNPDAPKTKTERLVDGQLKEVKATD